MKTLKLVGALGLLLLAGSFIIYSCQKDQSDPQDRANYTKTEGITYCGNVTTVDFLAGQFTNIGTVTVGNDANNLYVTYTTINGWVMNETHLYVGDCALIPLNNGNNPQIGQFPYATTHSPGVTSYMYTIPLSQLPQCMCVLAHAAVRNGERIETAWGNGQDVGGNSWATKFNYCKQECIITPPPTDTCHQDETAWATGTRYVTKGNWATYTDYSGVAKSVTIYAGQTIPVGTASFSAVSAGMVTITINLTGGWGLNNVSESVKIQGYSSTPPAKNPAPGQFTTYKGNDLTISVQNFMFYGIHLDVRKSIACN